MGTVRNQSPTADLFSAASARKASLPAVSQPASAPATAEAAAATSPPRHVLPKDLSKAMKQLGDPELDQLLSAVIAEQKRRGRELAVALGRKPRGEWHRLH
jgi:hypothetical protein